MVFSIIACVSCGCCAEMIRVRVVHEYFVLWKPSTCFATDNSLCQFGCCRLILFARRSLLYFSFLFFRFPFWAHVICCFRWFPLSHAVDWLFGRRISIRFNPPSSTIFTAHSHSVVATILTELLCCCCCCWEAIELLFKKKKKICTRCDEHCPSFNRVYRRTLSKFWWVIFVYLWLSTDEYNSDP